MKKHLLGYLFTNNVVRLMLLVQAMCDAIIIIYITNLVELNKYVGIHPTLEIGALITWVVASSWVMATILSFFIFGMSIINKSIFFRQYIFSVVFYFLFFVMMVAVGSLTSQSILQVVELFGLTSLAILTFRIVVFAGYKIYKYIFWKRRVIIIGCNEKGRLLEQSLLNDTSVLNIMLGYFDKAEPTDKYFMFKYAGSLDEVKDFALNNKIDEIYYALPNDPVYIRELSEFADSNFIFLGIIPDIHAQDRKKIHTRYLEDVDLPVISFQYSPLQEQVNSYIKRAFDIVFSAAVLLVLGPVFLIVIGTAIKLTSPGPVFFLQKRPGKSNRVFTCYKFRTMRINDCGELQASKNDARITKVGAFLRRTSLDELPQFYNVLKGDMSIVGPRPNLIQHLSRYKNSMPDYNLRHIVTPGITGFAQVMGYRGETKEDSLMVKRVELDMLYMQNWSLGMDLKIIIQTVFQIFRPGDKAY